MTTPEVGKDKFAAFLMSLSVRQLIAAMRFMNNGPLGYDPMKTGPGRTFSKDDLQTKAFKLAGDYARKTGRYSLAIENIKGALKGAVVDVSAASGTAELTGSALGHVGHDSEDGEGDGDMVGDETLEGGSGDYGAHAGADNDEEGSEEARPDQSKDDSTGKKEGKDKDKDKDKGKDKGKDKEGKPRKAPETPEEMLAEALRAMMAKGEDGDGEDKESDEETQERIDRAVAKAMKEKANTYRIEMKMPDGSLVMTDEDRPRHAVFAEVLQAVSRGLNVLLVGPAGSGKTHMAQMIAKALGLRFRFTGAVASEYKLLGFMSAHGVLVRTEYREAYENGDLFLWDELDGSAPQAMLSFNAGLANNQQDFPDKVVERHPNFRAIASANTYGHGADRIYVGRNQLDAASLDRFYTVYMDYDEALELSLFGDSEWVKYVHAARKATRDLSMRHVVSMRAIQMGLNMLEDGSGVPRKSVERAVLWKSLRDDDVAKVQAAMKPYLRAA